MRKLKFILPIILILALAVSPLWVWGAAAPCSTGGGGAGICYVNTASSGGDGTTTATSGAQAAFATIATVNGYTYAAGDQILFNKGDTWREQLTIPSSGSVGSPITFGAYGSGNKPIINGADLISTWTQFGGTVNSSPAANGDDGYAKLTSETIVTSAEVYFGYGASGPQHISMFIRSVLNIPKGATITTAYLTLIGQENDANGGIVDIYADDIDDSPAIDTFAKWSTAIGQKTTATANWDLPAIVKDTSYQSPEIKTIIQEIIDRDGWVSGQHIQLLLHDTASTVLNGFYGYDQGSGYAVLHVETTPNLWKATLTTEPYMVFIDGTFGDKKASIATLVNQYDWYWASNVLYLYAASDPDTLYVTPGIEASQRDYCINKVAGKEYITIDGLSCKYSQEDGIYAPTTVGALEVGIVIQNCTLNNIGWSGIYTECGFTISDNTISYIARRETANHTSGISILGHTSGGLWYKPTGTISGNNISYIYSETGQGITIWRADSINIYSNELSHCYDDAIALYGLVSNVNIYSNYIHNSGDQQDGTNNGIKVYADAASRPITSINIYSNNIVDNYGPGIALNSEIGTVNANIYYNILNHNNLGTTPGLGQLILYGADTQANVYNNAIYGGGSVGIYHWVYDASCNTNIKNNIVMGHTGVDLHVTDDSGIITLDYNCYYRSSGNLINYKTNIYTVATFSTYQSERSQDAHGMAVDPLFVTPGTDFHLQPASPCINVGVDVSLSKDYEKNPVPLGSAPDIGAYEFGIGGLGYGITGKGFTIK